MSHEPTDVGPKYGGDQPVDDDERRAALVSLSEALSAGRIDVADHQRRTQLAQSAATRDDLTELTRDLAGSATVSYAQPPSTAVARRGTADLTRAPADGTSRTFVGFFSEAGETASWRVPAKITAIAGFGAVTLDLSGDDWESDVVEVTALTAFGGIDLRVGPDTEVRNRAGAVFGGVSVRDDAGTNAAHANRVVIVHGFAVFGGIDVKGPKKPKK